MKLSIRNNGSLPYARKEPYEFENQEFEADLKTGDVITILDSGEVEQGNYGEQLVFKIKTRNGDKKLSFNQSTVNVLITEFGEDTEKWIDKEVNVLLQKKVIANKKCIVPYLVLDGWKLDDYGELNKETSAKDKDVDPKEIPF